VRVGLRPRVDENGIVERVEVDKVIKCLVEGKKCEKFCNNMKGVKRSCFHASKKKKLLPIVEWYEIIYLLRISMLFKQHISEETHNSNGL
jgi:acyl-[acyl carrier protein]--UDP-N-acetylglucosamine O-acyltransferase